MAAAGERGVDVLSEVRGKNHDALVVLDPLRQVIGFEIGAAVVDVAHVRALAEERAGLVEQEDDVEPLGPFEGSPQVLFRLSAVLADYGLAVHAMQIPAQPGGEDFSAKGLAGTVRP